MQTRRLMSTACMCLLKFAKCGMSGGSLLPIRLIRMIIRLSPAQVSPTEAYGSSELALALGD